MSRLYVGLLICVLVVALASAAAAQPSALSDTELASIVAGALDDVAAVGDDGVAIADNDGDLAVVGDDGTAIVDSSTDNRQLWLQDNAQQYARAINLVNSQGGDVGVGSNILVVSSRNGADGGSTAGNANSEISRGSTVYQIVANFSDVSINGDGLWW